MKTKLLLSCLLAGGLAVAQGQVYTTPVGYVTEELEGGQFNLIGLTVHNPTILAGTVESVGTNVVSVGSTDLASLLEAGNTYILAITDGPGAGIIQEVTSWGTPSVGDIDTPDDLSSVVTSESKFAIRKSSTVADVFGENNDFGLQGSAAFAASEADLIYIPNASGGFDRVFYAPPESGAQGWYNAANFAEVSSQPLVYADSMLILRRASEALEIVVSGEVKLSSTTSVVDGGGAFNYVGGVYPVGSVLGNSGLQDFLQGTDSFSAAEADLVYIPSGSGSFSRHFYSTLEGAEGWFNAATFQASDDQELTSGIIILNRGAQKNITISPPPSYSGL